MFEKLAIASLPLEHRPIALLNSNYKLFTKLLAVRLSGLLPETIDRPQVGFVPGRRIEPTLDIYAAAKIEAVNDEPMRGSLALLLDFAKAYDSLQSPFLLAVLQWLGFSPKFVKMVEALHQNTTCRSIVNGYLSRRCNVLCGICQSCPMAHSCLSLRSTASTESFVPDLY